MNYQRQRPGSGSHRFGIERLLYNQHIERLKNVQPVTDCHLYEPKSPPIPRYPDENNRFKRRIENENALLCSRLAKVQSGTHTHHHMSVIRQLRWKQHILHGERIKLQKRIAHQNARLLRDIQNVKPNIQLSTAYPSPSYYHLRAHKRPKSTGTLAKYTNKLQEIQQRWENIPSIENYPITKQVKFLLPTIDNIE